MSQIVEAVIDERGHVKLLEAVELPEPRRALVTILDDAAPNERHAQDLYMQNLDDAYLQMSQDARREAEAFEWSEALIGDAADEAR